MYYLSIKSNRIEYPNSFSRTRNRSSLAYEKTWKLNYLGEIHEFFIYHICRLYITTILPYRWEEDKRVMQSTLAETKNETKIWIDRYKQVSETLRIKERDSEEAADASQALAMLESQLAEANVRAERLEEEFGSYKAEAVANSTTLMAQLKEVCV